MPMGRTTSRRGTAAVLVAAGGLAIAGCSGGPADLMQPAALHATGTGSAAPSSAPTASGNTTSTRMAPLTGQPATARGAGRAAVAVPVTSDHPQGLAAADLVFEELSSPLRYIAVYQSRDDSAVGPVGQ